MRMSLDAANAHARVDVLFADIDDGALAERSTAEDVACAARFQSDRRAGKSSSPPGVKLGTHRETRRTPFGKSAAQSTRAPSALPQDFDGAIGVDAVRSAAVGDVFLVLRQPAQPAFSSSTGTEIAPAMWPAAYSLAGRVSRTTMSPRRSEPSGLQRTPPRRRAGRRIPDGPGARGHRADARPRGGSPATARTRRDPPAIVNEQTLASRLHQAGLLQGLQMLRGVGGREPDFAGQRLDRAFALGEQFENLEPVRDSTALCRCGRTARRDLL